MGKASAKTLKKYGVHTIGQLAAYDCNALVTLLGKQGRQLWEYANGLENSPVAPAGLYVPPKSIGNGQTFSQNLTRSDEMQREIIALADEVAVRLRHHKLKATTLQVTIRDPDFKDICRQRPLPVPTCTARELSQAAMEILSAHWHWGKPIRAITLTAHNLLPENEAAVQLDLFHPQADQRLEKIERLERVMDELRQKYGSHIITPAILIPAPSARKAKTE